MVQHCEILGLSKFVFLFMHRRLEALIQWIARSYQNGQMSMKWNSNIEILTHLLYQSIVLETVDSPVWDKIEVNQSM